MNRTQRAEAAEVDAVLEAERNQEPQYPIIEKPDAAQLGKTALVEAVDE